MEKNKNLMPEAAEKTEKKNSKKVKSQKPKKLKNVFAFKRGGYTLGLTAAVLVGVVVLNILVSALADRFNMEFDMTSDKINSMDAENIEFLKELDQEINITLCADKETYASGYMAYYAQQYGITEDAPKYYQQTLNLIEKYADYNKNIKIDYVDIQSTEFSALSSNYMSDSIGYGDIIVSTEKDGTEKHKIVTFKDIYQISEDDTYASYGYTTSTISGNNLESAVTSAIAFVTSSRTKKVAVLSGHSKLTYLDEYAEMLEENNYELEEISDALITEISDEYDAILISSPTIDFLASEIDAISSFLDNDGKLDKGLLFFADTNSPELPNFYDFLSQWGIEIKDGILFETNSSNHLNGEPMTLGSYPTDKEDDIIEDTNFCLTGYNVPIELLFESRDGIVVTPLIATPESVVAAPRGTANEWTGASGYEKRSYPTVVQAMKEDYNDKNEQMSSYVVAFSSMEFIYSPYNSQPSVSNREITLNMAERLVKADKTGVKFDSKKIETASYIEKVTESASRIVMVVFMLLIPILSIAAAIYIYITRRNA